MQQRRWERALGVAIRDGQARGIVRGEREGAGRPKSVIATRDVAISSPYEYAKHGELYGDGREGGNGAYAMADNADDADFEEALTGAKAEGNAHSRSHQSHELDQASPA